MLPNSRLLRSFPASQDIRELTMQAKQMPPVGSLVLLLHGYIIALMNFYASISFIFNFYAFCSVFYAMFFYIICIFLLAIKIKLLYSKGKFKKDST